MSDQPNPSGTRQALKITAIGIAVAGVFAGQGRAQDSNGDDDSDSGKPTTPAGPTTSLPPLVVTGTATAVSHEIPQSIVAVGQDEIAEQGTTSLEDALRNVPGITLNSGEGGAHGDSINLRGISVPDSFFLDGLRDIGTYQRDTFDEQTVELPLGPSSVLFGRGSTAGVINQVTKQPLLAPLEEASVVIGTAGMERGTADLNWVMGDHAAARLDLMGQSSGVADRDYVRTTRNGIAPAVAFGIDQPTSLTVSFLHQDENDIPDYGIPFVDGTPANVDRGNYYGLLNYDRTETEADIATARFEHKFNDHFSLTHSLRYGHYEFAYLLSAPHLDDDYTQPPAPGSPLADILVYRDQPSSAGTEEEFVDRTDLTSKFEVAGIRHSLITGVELSSERSDISRYENGIDTIPPTPLLDPDPNYSPPTPLIPDALPRISGSDVSAYAMDRMRLGAHWDLDGGFRWDSFDSHFSDALSGTAFSRNDTEVSPRAAVVFNPSAGQSIYLSYGESYNPAIEYLTPCADQLQPLPRKGLHHRIGSQGRCASRFRGPDRGPLRHSLGKRAAGRPGRPDHPAGAVRPTGPRGGIGCDRIRYKRYRNHRGLHPFGRPHRRLHRPIGCGKTGPEQPTGFREPVGRMGTGQHLEDRRRPGLYEPPLCGHRQLCRGAKLCRPERDGRLPGEQAPRRAAQRGTTSRTSSTSAASTTRRWTRTTPCRVRGGPSLMTATVRY
jgi:catecholate siderophore receptor